MPPQPRDVYNPVPEVSPSLSSGNDYLNIRATPEAFGAQVGEAGEKLGQTLEQTGDTAAKLALDFQQQHNNTVALNATTQGSTELSDLENNFRQLKGLNAVNSLPQYQAKIAEIQNRIADSMPNPSARLTFLDRFARYSDTTVKSLGLYTGDQADAANMAALNGSIDAAKSRAVLHSGISDTEPDFHDIVGATAQVAAKMGLPKEAADALVQKHVGDTMQDIITARISMGRTNDAAAIFQNALKETAPGTDLPLLDGDHQSRISSIIANRQYTDLIRQQAAEAKAERDSDRYAAQMRVNLSHTYDNAASMVMSGHEAQDFPNHAQIDAAYPRNPDLASDMKEKVDDLRTISGYLGILPGATPEQVAQLKAAVAPDPTKQSDFGHMARISKALDTALDYRAKAIGADSAGYVIGTHPEIADQFTATQKDTTQFPAYAQTVLGIQTQMGVPETMQHVLPVSSAQGIAQDIESSAEKAPAKLQQLEQQYGPAWTNVWRDLSTIGGLPSGYQSVGALDDPRDAGLLARAISEQGKSGKAWGDILGTKVESDIKTAVRTDPSIQQFSTSLSRSGASASQIDSIMTSVDTLAYAKSFYDRDPKAAQNAIASFTSKYEFMPNGGARVPSANFDAVNQNASAVLSALDASKISVPSLYGQPGQPKPDEYLDVLRSAPSWITSPKADALWLMDSGGRLVRTKDGSPVSVPFNAPPPAGIPGSYSAPDAAGVLP